jgi:nucleotide-binding universal stress UspA family protein
VDSSDADRTLAEALAGVEEEFPDVDVTREAVPLRPEDVLVDASESASLLVVGARGRNPFARLLLGSVSQHVLQHAHCPVAIVR